MKFKNNKLKKRNDQVLAQQKVQEEKKQIGIIKKIKEVNEQVQLRLLK
jgi:hypothetical protein